MFLNSGSEAIDGALKLARRVTGRPGIIAFRGGFHGRTFGATSVTTSNLNYRTGYEPLLPGVYFAPYPIAYPEFGGDEEAASRGQPGDPATRCSTTVVAPSTVGAILIEPVLGEGGYIPAPASFLQRAARRSCDEHGILLIADEVQSGYGRTGRDVGVRARRDRARTSCAWPRRSPTACRSRRSSRAASSRSAGDAARTARRTAATRWPAPPGWRSSRRSATRAWSPTRARAARSSWPASARSRPRTTGSATSAGSG